jgi:hypothetical protein
MSIALDNLDLTDQEWLRGADIIRNFASSYAPCVRVEPKESSTLCNFMGLFVFDKEWWNTASMGLGSTIYIPERYTFSEACSVLRHEAEHCLQCRRLGLGSYRLGIIPFLLIYGLILFPVFLALGRLFLETQACAAQWTEDLRMRNRSIIDIDKAGRVVVDELAGAPYWWTAPKFIVRRVVYWYGVRALKAGS